MAIKNPIYLFLPLPISPKIVFTLRKLGIFPLMVSKDPIHIFIIPHAIEIHIPPSLVRSRLDSLANRCKIIVIVTRICVFVNKLFKIKPDIPYGYTNRISSAISPTILLLYQIHLIF